MGMIPRDIHVSYARSQWVLLWNSHGEKYHLEIHTLHICGIFSVVSHFSSSGTSGMSNY